MMAKLVNILSAFCLLLYKLVLDAVVISSEALMQQEYLFIHVKDFALSLYRRI